MKHVLHFIAMWEVGSKLQQLRSNSSENNETDQLRYLHRRADAILFYIKIMMIKNDA